MKHILLSTAALAGLAMAAAAPAGAQEPALQLGISGYAAGYAVYTGGDTAPNSRKFDFRKHSEVYLSGEVALDNGITAGAHVELQTDRADNTDGVIQESYIYLSSNWGRVNFGEEDGVGYLLQVAAPSADANIDGLRPIIGTLGVDANALSAGLQAAGMPAATANALGTMAARTFGGSYAQDDTGYSNKFSYITPVFSGFQAGVSFTPTVGEDVNGLTPTLSTNNADQFENAWEIAARYEGSFDAVDLALGAGYSHASLESKALSVFDTAWKTWNVGANVGFGAFGVGAAYLNSNNGFKHHGDYRAWVGGVDYKTGPYKLGLSYLNGKQELAVNTSLKQQRWTAGGIYEWGPGMTFRGAVQYVDTKATGIPSDDGVQVTLGTQLNF